ncbi:MAG TPA: hypothetical protein VE987_00130, partial [Polyangiaceae bacterium]|nr:hypothetical protein [Polyangiaceae bacterium]
MNAKLGFVLAAIGLAVAAASGCEPSKKNSAGPPPPAVLVSSVVRRDVPLYIDAVGALDGYDNAEIRARVRGFLRTQSYKDGSFVKAGQTLFT